MPFLDDDGLMYLDPLALVEDGMTTLQRALMNEMSRLSEECYCAGWLTGIEYQLWEVVLGTRREYGLYQFTSEEISGLRELSKLCGGWIVWSDEEKGEVFVPIEQWEAMFPGGQRP